MTAEPLVDFEPILEGIGARVRRADEISGTSADPGAVEVVCSAVPPSRLLEELPS